MTYRKKLQVALFLEIINTASTRVARHCEEPKPRAKRDGRCPLCHCEERSDEAISNLATEEIEL